MADELERLLDQWSIWSMNSDQSEDGWQSDFPGWAQLIAIAAERMKGVPSTRDLELIARCWELSEEGEELAEVARAAPDACWVAIEAIARRGGPAARWQAYDVAAELGPRAEPLLRAALDDADPYARRRGALALARLRPHDSRQLATSLMRDPDPYMRQASIEFARAANDPDLTRVVCELLSNDPVEHVRTAARRR